jgi:hypothetical protein
MTAADVFKLPRSSWYTPQTVHVSTDPCPPQHLLATQNGQNQRGEQLIPGNFQGAFANVSHSQCSPINGLWQVSVCTCVCVVSARGAHGTGAAA